MVQTNKWSPIFSEHSLSDCFILDKMKEMVGIVEAGNENALFVRVGDVADRNREIQLKL